MTSLFGGGTSLVVGAAGSVIPQQFTPIDGQTVFTLSAFSYIPNTTSLWVFVNGDKQRSGLDFTETSGTSFTLNSPVLAIDVVEVIGFPAATLTVSGLTSVVSNLISQLFTATAGQTLFILTSGAYTQGNNSLVVYMNGLKLRNGIDYTETSTTSFTLVNGASLGDELDCISGVTVNAAISAGVVGFQQSGTGAVPTDLQTQLRRFPVNLDNYGAVGTGLVDDSNALALALAASDTVYGTPGKIYLISSQVTVGSNKRLLGNGAILQSAVGITMLLFSGNGSALRDWVVNANGGLYTIRNNGLRNTFCENRFIGSVGHYIFSPAGSSHTAIQNNVVDGQGVSLITTCFVFEDSVHINVTGNRFIDIQNWCVQVRGASSRVTIADNNCFATQYTASVVATAGQTIFNFTLTNACHLAGIQVNGAPFDTGLTFLPTVPAATPITAWQVTFASGRTVGDVVKLIAHRAAENIQINGSTTDFSISGNTISGGGDSGIVVTSTAQRGTIVGNTIRDIAYTGISLEGGIQQVSIVGNMICNTSLITTAATYSSCILIGGPDNLVEGNTLSNIFGAPTAYSAISINYYASEDGTFDESIKIGMNNYAGVFTKKLYIPNQSGTQKRQSIELMDGMTTYYPERINLESAYTNTPANTAFWAYSGFGGTFSIRDTTIKQGGSASLKTVAGEYVDMQPLAAAALMDCVVNFSFWAIANSGSSYVTAFLDVGGSLVGSPAVTVSSTSWQQYNINFPFSSNEVASSLKFRVGANSGFANFQHFEMSITKLS